MPILSPEPREVSQEIARNFLAEIIPPDQVPENPNKRTRAQKLFDSAGLTTARACETLHDALYQGTIPEKLKVVDKILAVHEILDDSDRKSEVVINISFGTQDTGVPVNQQLAIGILIPRKLNND